jgi:curved DNA-binding protein CbpA
MAGVTVFVPTDIALQGADLVSGGQVVNVKKGVELLLLNNIYAANGPSAPTRGQCDVSVLLRQGLDFLSKSPHDALGVPVGCRTPEIRKAYKKLALKYHPDKNPLTTPLFQLMSSAHDRLTDPVQRQKEERTAAAKNPKPTPKPPQQPPAPAGPPNSFPSATGAGAGTGAGANAGAHNPGNPPQPRQTYDPKTGKWSGEAEWGKYQQQPSGTDQGSKAQEAARRKQYYDEILREQFKKAESDRKAKEYAAMKEAQAKQRAGAAGSGATAGTATGATAGASAGSGKPGDASSNPNTSHYNYQNPHMRYPYPNTGAGGASAGVNATASAGYPSSYNYGRPTPPSDTASAGLNGGGAGAYAGRQQPYKPATDTKVHPQNVPQYGKVPSSREAPPSAGASKPGTARGSVPGTAEAPTASRGSAGTGTATGTASSAAAGAVPPNAKYGSGIAGAGDHGGSSNNLRSGVKPNASRVPRPYGLRCLFVGTNAAELEWVTSKYHRNSLLAELSWRIKEGDMNASWRGTWESASKLISSGKCRKKNLVPGAIYEFRVRAVEELAGGLLGYRSDWSDTITVTLLPDKTTHSHGQGAAQVSPSHKGLAPKPSGRGKEAGAFSFPDVDTKGAESSAAQPPKAAPTFERFSTHAKAPEPKVNIYDTLNTGVKEKVDIKAGAPAAASAAASSSAAANAPAAADGRKSTSALPTKTSVSDTASSTPTTKASEKSTSSASSATTAQSRSKASSQASSDIDSPIQEMHKINIDNIKRYPNGSSGPGGLGGSGRNVWGPDSVTPAGSRSNTAQATKGSAQTTSSGANKNGAAASRKFNKAKDTGNGSDGEVEEDIHDGGSSVDAGEVDDEVNTVGVDEDSSSVHTNTGAKNKSKPAVDGKKAAQGQAASKAAEKKGEFADFTIEVEDETDEDECDESEIDEDEFDVEYEEMYTLVAPAAKVKAAKKSPSSGNLSLYSHPVRSEPVLKSAIVGYLVLGTDVLACADAGNWLKVKIHKQPTRKNSMRAAEDIVEWGWSLRADKTHEYLKPNKEALPPLHHPHFSKESPAVKAKGSFTPNTPLGQRSTNSLGSSLGNRSMTALPKYPKHTQPGATRHTFNEKDVPVWMELVDVSGHAYYFNEATGESQWEPPEWVEERDPASGAK